MRAEHTPWAIVAGEDDECVGIKLGQFEGRHDPADGPIDFLDHIPVPPAVATSLELFGREDRRVRHVVREIQEERLVPRRANPFHSLCRVAAREQFLIGRMLHHLAAANERHGKAELGAVVKHLTRLAFARRRRHIVAARRAEVIIEAALEWVHEVLRKIFGVTGQVPFSQNGGGISLPLEHCRHEFFWGGREFLFADQCRMSSAHQSCATGNAG